MKEYSVLISGKSGFGINHASLIIASLFNHLGYNIYIYRDYPSLIQGGHSFCIIRASLEKIGAHQNKVDFILALDQKGIDLHKDRIKENTLIIFDSDSVKAEGISLNMKKMVAEEKGSAIMRNTCIIGAFCKASGIEFNLVEEVLRLHFKKETEQNLNIAKKAYDSINISQKIPKLSSQKKSIILGNDAIGLGLVKAGLQSYISYPMTPTSGILHFLAKVADDFNLKVIHPESELAAIMMALGFAYAGNKSAIGTSGGGYCLMTEGISLSGIAELPVVVIMGQRPGPATGLPTYTGQSELDFVLYSGHGEFTKFITAPSDAEDAYYWAAIALNLAWKYQIPSFVLIDKTLAEGTYSFDLNNIKPFQEENASFWDGKGEYKRYLDTDSGVSSYATPSTKNATVKVNSYEHDEFGLTIEDAQTAIKMFDKRARKEKALIEDLEKYEQVSTFGNIKSNIALLCWGSNRDVCIEVAKKFNIKVINQTIINPFPKNQLKKATNGVKKLICIENNSTGQLASLVKLNDFKVDEKILRYDGRPFSVDELEKEVAILLNE